jgi:hypothetical protein
MNGAFRTSGPRRKSPVIFLPGFSVIALAFTA